jgi:hypothetical protein
MDFGTTNIPSPSTAWSRVATSRELPIDSGSTAAALSLQHRDDDASQLRARLLKMIVDSEHSRKSAATEAFNGR